MAVESENLRSSVCGLKVLASGFYGFCGFREPKLSVLRRRPASPRWTAPVPPEKGRWAVELADDFHTFPGLGSDFWGLLSGMKVRSLDPWGMSFQSFVVAVSSHPVLLSDAVCSLEAASILHRRSLAFWTLT